MSSDPKGPDRSEPDRREPDAFAEAVPTVMGPAILGGLGAVHPKLRTKGGLTVARQFARRGARRGRNR